MSRKNRKRLTTTIEEKLLKRAKLQAVQEDIDLNDLIEKALAAYLKKIKAS